jgi:hypothetical protein
MPVSDYTGDYSTVEVDPTDGTTFWAANEYIGTDGGTDIWRTHIASFQATIDPGANYYAVRVKGGDPLDITVTVPGAGSGPFANAFVPAVYLYDPGGHLVAFDEAQGGNDRTVTIHYRVPKNGHGRYTIRVAPSPSTPQPTEGENALVVSGGEDDRSDAAASMVMIRPSGRIRAAASDPTTAVGGGDGRGAALANSFVAAVRDAAGTPATSSGSGGAARNVNPSSPLTTSIFGTLDRPEGPLRLPVAGKPYPLGHDPFDKSRFRAKRRAGVVAIKALPKGKALLKPGATFESVDHYSS